MKNLILAGFAVAVVGTGLWLLISNHPTKPHPHAADTADTDEPRVEPEPSPPVEPSPPANRLLPLAGHPAHRPSAARPAPPSAPAPVDHYGAARAPGEDVKGPAKLEIVEPPEDAKDPSDRSARLAAETYKTLVKAMNLDSEQEDRFKRALYDSKTSYAAAMESLHKNAVDDKLDPEARAAAAAEVTKQEKRAWEDQKLVGDDAMKEILGPDQLRTYTTIVQNPLFLANGLRFKEPEAPKR